MAFLDPDLDCKSETTDPIESGSNQESEPKHGYLGCDGYSSNILVGSDVYFDGELFAAVIVVL